MQSPSTGFSWGMEAILSSADVLHTRADFINLDHFPDELPRQPSNDGQIINRSG